MTPTTHILEVWGDLACFTRPEMKVERFSYPVITPSAARAIFDAIYYKPKFRWQVTRVDVLQEPMYIALRRNETKEKANVNSVKKWMKGEEVVPIFTDLDRESAGTDQKGRTQRQTMALKNVHYRLYAHAVLWNGSEQDQIAIDSQFRRRAARGQCIYQPYLGCREFPAYFELLEDTPEQTTNINNINIDIGWMLYDVFDLSQPGSWDSPACISLFHAAVKSGVMTIPEYTNDSVRKAAPVVHLGAETDGNDLQMHFDM